MWWMFFLLLLIGILLMPLIWAMFRVSKLRFADARGHVIAPEQVPTETLLRLKNQVEPLLGTGFEYLGMRREERGEKAYWQVFLSSAGGMVWAVAEEDDEGAGRRVSLYSFGSDDQVAITRDGDEVFGEQEPGVLRCQESFGSAMQQAEAHAALLTEEGVQVVPLDPETFLTRYERLVIQSLDSLFEKGWLQETAGKELKISLGKLPLTAIAWAKHQLQSRKRAKAGASWLLEKNLAAGVETESELATTQLDEDSLEKEDLSGELESAMPVANLEEEPVVVEPVQETLADSSAILAEQSTAISPDEKALATSAVEALPVGPIDEPLEGSGTLGQLEESSVNEVAEQEPSEQEVMEPIPEEDGLERDLALYHRQASARKWSYWLGGFGGRAFFFFSLLAFAVWMVMSGAWVGRVVLFGVLALFVHEVGHAVLMLLRRSWDWSHFLLPLPRPMSARSWNVKGGWGELFTVLAGPLPGLLFGWFFIVRAYLGVPVSDLLLDAAFAAVVVNTVALLPFLPLDGGRLMDLAVLRRVPQLRVFGLVITGLVLCGLSFLGGGAVFLILGVLMWSGIPAARRKGKLLPWFRANEKDEEEAMLTAAYAITRERAQRKSFKGVAGIARLDELIGLARAKPLGAMGGMLALGILVLTFLAPFAIPAVGLAQSGQDWFKEQERAEELAKGYLGELRPLKPIGDSESEKQAREDALWNLNSWQEGVASAPSQASKVFADDEVLNDVRAMQWNLAAHWIADAPEQRQVVAREAALALRSEAILAADNGEAMQAFRDLSFALRIIIQCEPRHSLDSWISWLELEREVLKEVEDVSSRYALADTYVKWFEGALEQCPRPSGRKFAGLLLAESKGYESLLEQFQSGGPLLGQSNREEAGTGRRFLSRLEGIGQLFSVAPLQKRIRLSDSLVAASSLREIVSVMKAHEFYSSSMEESFTKVENNSAFRQIALSAMKVKRLGMDGAKPELAKLRDEYGYQARVDTMGKREALKLSRLTAAGEVVEMEWLLQQ